MTLEIIPICMGEITGLPQPMITFPFGFGKMHTTKSLVFVIKGGEHPIVVDTGPCNPEWTKKYHGYELIQKESEVPEVAFRSAGINLEDVKIVINTHLHWDHCFNNNLFTNAEFYVQKRELNYAMDPIEIHRPAYEKIPGIIPPWVKVWDRIKIVDGDEEIAPNISVVLLPGHSPGSQGVLVSTGKNKYLLAGDCVDTYENWHGNDMVSHIPSGVHTDLIEFENSFKNIEKIERAGYEVIPSHDNEVLVRGVLR
ncbi:N-acyl homoserine lactonase family protein [Planococcus sp. X10-3]|uniref:N-acyl homoserine lactonase family protein n=1 Tax=Planococcus sp. X10-3 TaxID=3061240 RepID=UPI003BAFD1FB